MGVRTSTLLLAAMALIGVNGRAALADDWSWIDQLKIADTPTKDRLKICFISSKAHFDSIKSCSFDYTMSRDLPSGPHRKGTEAVFQPATYRGTVRWRSGGSVHYTYQADLGEKRDIFSVIRTKEMLAYLEDNPAHGLFIIVEHSPTSIEKWWMGHKSRMSALDPAVHYGGLLSFETDAIRQFADACRLIESEVSEGLVTIRFFRKETTGRVDLYFDKGAEYLPVKVQSGDMQGQVRRILLEHDWEWQNAGGIYYPKHFTETRYLYETLTPAKSYDIRISNLRLNRASNVSDSDFELASMEAPKGVYGIDRRVSPPLQLISDGKRVRESHPGEKLTPPATVKARLEEESKRSQAAAGLEAQAVLSRRIWNKTLFWGSIMGSIAIAAFVARRVWSRSVAIERR